MKIIVPMAGRGSRLRPHTLLTPKPLVSVAGKPIVQRLVEDLTKMCGKPVDEIAFVIGDFGKEVETQLENIASSLGAKGTICYQNEPLGTAHAILCAEEALEGEVLVAFADTLVRADFELDESKDGVLWVKQIDDPSSFGVVALDENNTITDYVEKPTTFVSDLAMIGIYFFKDGANLKSELQYLIDNNIIKGGEYQLPDALRNMTKKGLKFSPGEVSDWLDCGNKAVTVESNRRMLELIQDEELVNSSAKVINSVIIPPCFIGENAVIENSVVGPFVSVGADTSITNSRVEDSIIQQSTRIENANMIHSMVGQKAEWIENRKDLSIGDFSKYKA